MTQKGGHVVWLGKDIRNQSPQCSVLPALGAIPAVSTPDHLNVPHAHTLRLFREALRCAAGITASTATIAAADSGAERKLGEVEFSDSAGVGALVSSTAELGSELSPHAPLRPQITTCAGNATSATVGCSPLPLALAPHGVVVSFDMGALQGSVRGSGYITGSSSSATGLTVDEILDMAMVAGADPNVSFFIFQ